MSCRWCEFLLAAVILVFAIWPTQIFPAVISWWIIVVSAVLLLVHALFCAKCKGLCCGLWKGNGAGMGARRRRRRR